MRGGGGYSLVLHQPELKQKYQEELQVWRRTALKRSLGNICFIGELFKLKVSRAVVCGRGDDTGDLIQLSSDVVRGYHA